MISRYATSKEADILITILGLHPGYMAYNEFFELGMGPLLALVQAKYDHLQRIASGHPRPWTAETAAEVVMQLAGRWADEGWSDRLVAQRESLSELVTAYLRLASMRDNGAEQVSPIA